MTRDAGREGIVAQRAADGAGRPFSESDADVFVGRDFSSGDRQNQVVYCPVVRRDSFSGLGAERLALGAGLGVVDVACSVSRISQSAGERSLQVQASFTFRVVLLGFEDGVALVSRRRRGTRCPWFNEAYGGINISFC